MNQKIQKCKQGGGDDTLRIHIYLDGMRSYAVRKIRDRIKVPETLSDTDFILDVVFNGVLIPDPIKDKLRKSERKILEEMYYNHDIPVEKLQGIEQLKLFPKTLHITLQ